MDAERALTLHHLRRELMSARTRGRVVVEFDDGAADATEVESRQVADSLLSLVNLPRLGPHWVAVERDRARDIIAAVLHWDLETMQSFVAEPEALALAESFLTQFPGRSTYWTNVRPAADLSRSPHRWASGKEQDELDAGVAVVSADLTGLVWVEDRP